MIRKWLLPVLCLFFLTACGAIEGNADLTDDNPGSEQEEVIFELPEYAFDSFVHSESLVREDTGEEAASYRYDLPVINVVNEKYLTEEDGRAALRNVENFNGRMNELMDELEKYGKELLEEQKSLLETEDVPFAACDEAVAGAVVMGNIVTVTVQCYNYCGGAHPNTYVVTYTFDLSTGQFIDPAQIADDPEEFRVSAAEFLVQAAEGLGEDYTSGYWPDYQDIIARWNETAVRFDETGMTVIFSPYELGPYAMGTVELTLNYDVLAELIGSGGMTLLGLS